MIPDQNLRAPEEKGFATRRTSLCIQVVAGILIFCLTGCAVPVAALEDWGTIQVRAFPANASVLVDDQYSAGTDDRGFGSVRVPGEDYYTVVVSKDGWQSFSKKVFVKKNATRVVLAVLMPLKLWGRS